MSFLCSHWDPPAGSGSLATLPASGPPMSTTEAEVLGWVARATGLLLGHIHAIPELMSSLGSKCSVCRTDTLCGSEHIPALVCTRFACVCLPVSIYNAWVPFSGQVSPRVSESQGLWLPRTKVQGPHHDFQYCCCPRLRVPLSLVPSLPHTAWEDTRGSTRPCLASPVGVSPRRPSLCLARGLRPQGLWRRQRSAHIFPAWLPELSSLEDAAVSRVLRGRSPLVDPSHGRYAFVRGTSIGTLS